MRVAIIGTGSITERFLQAAKDVQEIAMVAVMSRNREKGQEYATWRVGTYQQEQLEGQLSLFD